MRVLNLVTKYEVQYTVSSRVGDSRSRMKSRPSKVDIDKQEAKKIENKFFKQTEKSPMMRDNNEKRYVRRCLRWSERVTWTRDMRVKF